MLDVGEYSEASDWGGRKNALSSIRSLPSSETESIALFDHGNYKGRMVVLYGDTPKLSSVNFNNDAGSFIVIKGTWILYGGDNYKGSSFTVGPGDYPDFSGYPINQGQLSSLRPL